MDLSNARIEINEIDKEIVKLLERRLNVVTEIGKYKKENNLPIYDEEREKLVVNNCVSHLENKNYSKAIEEIYKQIMNTSKVLEAPGAIKKSIVIIGMPGSGKTTIGALVAKKLSMKFVDMDLSIEENNNMTISEMFQISEEYFRDLETNYARELSKQNSLVISTGGGIIKRKENIDYLKQNSIIVFLNRSPERIISDIDITTRPLLKENIENIFKLYKERLHLYKKYSDIEILNDSTIDEATKKIAEAVITKK